MYKQIDSLPWYSPRTLKPKKNVEESDPIKWLPSTFPNVCSKPFGDRHIRLLNWFDELEPEVKPLAHFEPWPRGGAKSVTACLGVAWLWKKLARHFVLYVSETQAMADKHVGFISSLLEEAGAERKLNMYGSSKGWRRSQLSTSDNFHVAGFGLDTGVRGIRSEQFRPDLIIIDDIDNNKDTALIIQKKIDILTTSILPAGSPDCGVLFIQNYIHSNSIISQILTNRLDILTNRDKVITEPAIRDMVGEYQEQPNGARVYKILSGTPTWSGQSIKDCENQIAEWGLKSFLREAQHDVSLGEGYFFDSSKFEIIAELPNVPLKFCRAWDFAATQDGGDYTVGVLLATDGVLFYVVDVIRVQYSSDKVKNLVLETAKLDKETYGDVLIRIPQDPGSAGKTVSDQFTLMLKGYNVISKAVTGSKAIRATGWSEKVSSGNTRLLKANWNFDYIEEHRQFREDLGHTHDDQIDASSDSCTELITPKKQVVFHLPI